MLCSETVEILVMLQTLPPCAKNAENANAKGLDLVRSGGTGSNYVTLGP